MKAQTFADLQRFARISGFTLKRITGGYSLSTPYGDYKRATLREINSIIIRDGKRASTARF
jgi:hypothetical protein